MAKTNRQTAIFGVEDWKRIYTSYREADFQSYDFETLRKSFIDYIQVNYPENFNDYTESSEFIALMDVIAFMGQALAFRNDMNIRENFLDSAERRDSVVRLAELVGYTPKRNIAAQGYLKVQSISTTENVVDYTGKNLSGITINWNDDTNSNWMEQFTAIFNAALVSSQKFSKPGATKTILGVDTQEYSIRLGENYLPIIPFNATVGGTNMGFEAVGASFRDKDYVYEPAPKANGIFNVLFRNDKLGYASPNTGLFFLFKQGSLQNQDFTLGERISGRVVSIDIEGINNEDVWLYQLDNAGDIQYEWTKTPSIYSVPVDQLGYDQRKLFSVTSRTNDQVSLNFGDGVFSEIPLGSFRSYVRSSNGLQYIINPEEMQSIRIVIGYTSRKNQSESITFTCGLNQSVSNPAPRENIDDIKQRAPARYYTQNRMVNGEDYGNFPFTMYSTILKSKAVNRSAVGTSRYLDLADVTGKYSSTNIFASDGMLYEKSTTPSFTAVVGNLNDIANVVDNEVGTAIRSRGMLEFYYNKFPRIAYETTLLKWDQRSALVNATTGNFLLQSTNRPITPGDGNYSALTQGSLIKFVAPDGYYFDAGNRLAVGVPVLSNDKTYIWATITAINPSIINDSLGGTITLNNFVPTGAIPAVVIKSFLTSLPPDIKTEIIDQMRLYKNFGLGYDSTSSKWYVITQNNLKVNGSAFSLANAQNKSGQNLDDSWLVLFETDHQMYSISYRELGRYWASVLQTRFFYDGNQQIYDPRTGNVVNDYINCLKTNSLPGSSQPLNRDVIMDIIGQPTQSDGYVDDYQVQISFSDSDNDGVADDPDYFQTIVFSNAEPQSSKLVFFQRTQDFDNIEKYQPLPSGAVVSRYSSLTQIQLAKAEYLAGQYFYATAESKFYKLLTTIDGVRTIVEVLYTDSDALIARTGRQDLAFQYVHNASLNRRIDPGASNIVDLYLVTSTYYAAYQNYINDSTNTVPKPASPTIEELSSVYDGLNEFKMISDNIIFNSVVFKPLFGNKAEPALRATIKLVRNSDSSVSDSEIKSRAIAAINDYFTIDKWDFGVTFYFSELGAYLHKQLDGIISAAVLVPVDPERAFGDLYEIRCMPNEIFTNAATVTDIEVIESLTSGELRTTKQKE